MKDIVFLLLTLAAAILLALVSVVVQFEILHDPALLVMLALGAGFTLWGVIEDQSGPPNARES